VVDAARFRLAEIAAARELENIAHEYFAMGWEVAVGSSGTAREIEEILEQNGFNGPLPAGRSGGITRGGLERLKSALIKAGAAEKLGLHGMRADRIPVLSGGLAILSAVFEFFELEYMGYGDGALRLGVLYDLLGRFHHHDMRDATVAQFQRRYQVDMAQAARVETYALGLFEQLAPGLSAESDAVRTLTWAARMHEIGISVAHSGYHKHGAYILTFADMPGFAKKDQGRLAFLVLGHRGKLDKLAGLAREEREWLMVFSLRMAALFNRSRHGNAPKIAVRRTGKGFLIKLPRGWLGKHAMTRGALDDEVVAWRATGFELEIEGR
jgi:exopolyphosphatase/guanosine-5'-triphosphate,3'-diphosphate pyrophosphatase